MRRARQTAALFLVGRARKLLGVAFDGYVVRRVRDGGTDLMKVVRNDPATVTADQHLSELLEPAADSSLPIAVVDENMRLIGVVPRVTLLAALANQVSTNTGENPVVEPPATVPVSLITQTLRETGGPTDGAVPATEGSN